MSHPKNYWYSFIKNKIIGRYESLDEGIESDLLSCINATLMEVSKEPDGNIKVEAINKILIKKTETPASLGRKIFYSERTIYRWTSEFINRVGIRAGFPDYNGNRKP